MTETLVSRRILPVDVWRCAFMEMKRIELELAYVGYVKKKKSQMVGM